MEYRKLKDEIVEIATIAGSVPEPFREKCFEVLLQRLLAPAADRREKGSPAAKDGETNSQPNEAEPPEGNPITWNAAVRAFMKRTGVTDQQLERAFYCDDGDFHFLVEPSTSSSVRGGVIQWALLLAARNGIVSGVFEVDPEDARSMCQEKGYYDNTNFWKVFKADKYKKFFAGDIKPQGEPRKLTTTGQEQLAEAIRSLVG